MQHPAIVTIFDVGVDEPSGAPFMVLEYLPGESLEGLVIQPAYAGSGLRTTLR